MDEKMTKFYEALSADEELRAELVRLTDSVVVEGVTEEEARHLVAEVVAVFAVEHGFDLSQEDILAARSDAESELSEAELAAVAGGGGASICFCVIIGALKGCGCFFMGGDNSENMGVICAFGGGGIGD